MLPDEKNSTSKRMSKLISLIEKTQKELNLSLGQNIPESAWPDIAQSCGDIELKEIRNRILSLDSQSQNAPEWDEHIQDDIFFAKRFLEGLLKLIEENKQ